VTSVVVIDSGGANLASLGFALERLGVRSHITVEASAIAAAERVILPGVGNARAIMDRLESLRLVEVIRSLRCPVLGICLGMQILFEHSAEGDTPTLGIIPGRVEAITPRPGLSVPHMGWNTLMIRHEDPLLSGIGPGDWFYFVHGYHAPAASSATIATSDHGGEFAAVVRRSNFFGVQFHPERSAAAGARVLGNFMELPSCN